MIEQRPFPPASLTNQDGELVQLPTGSPSVVFFYPKDLTPGCTQECIDFNGYINEIKKHGFSVYGVSKDSEASHKKFHDKLSLSFDLLTDEDAELAESLGITSVGYLFGNKYKKVSRSTFIVDEKGIIQKALLKVNVKSHVVEVLSFIEMLFGKEGS